ncbi:MULTISPECIES: hypothetical protein [unclassified Anabaena]|uniref:hypothetical protein n=1 Tax=unclassified Anabaena TaxID=2619674 RepID=UPI0014481438|nr:MULTISPECIES: hypothetical protein [unclassified Anabaena]MTJ07645.1 hypothetical protein [Anabaena sp. UHCC 0204]MTJ51387.1 hypothetical protein [Anabaena sp. UHCC 0253]
MTSQITTSNLLVELSTEDQELLSGGRRRCVRKCYWDCYPKKSYGGQKGGYDDRNGYDDRGGYDDDRGGYDDDRGRY